MAFFANVINVMIASPGDVEQERREIRAAIHAWNEVHAEERGLALLPVGWETHSSPAMGDRPQSIINRQVLERCDLLVGVFWTRLGTPTGVASSGTVEEISRHLDEGKPAMIYFSNVPAKLESVDHEQYAALKSFRAQCKTRGLIETFDTLEDFRDKFNRHLMQTVIREFTSSSTVHDFERNRPQPLSREARELLIQASLDRSGEVVCLRSMDGLSIQTNNKSFGETGNPRSEAKWKAAVEELEGLGFLEARGHAGQIFGLTDAGYRMAEELAEQNTPS